MRSYHYSATSLYYAMCGKLTLAQVQQIGRELEIDTTGENVETAALTLVVNAIRPDGEWGHTRIDELRKRVIPLLEGK